MLQGQLSREPLLWSPAASPGAHWVGGWMGMRNWESFWAPKAAQQYELQRVMSSVLLGPILLYVLAQNQGKGCLCWR